MNAERKGNPRSPRRVTEHDGERTSEGEAHAKEKGLMWTKYVPKEMPLPFTKRDDSHMSRDEVTFLPLGESVPTHAYDIGGMWKVLYKKPGEDDKPVGPGLKPRDQIPYVSPKATKPKVSYVSPKATKPRAVKKTPPPMKIFVRCSNGSVFPLVDVKPEDTIDDIQDRIEQDYSIPRKQQLLRFGSQPLSDPDLTLKQCDIKDQSTLDLDPMQIFVREPISKKKHTLTVDPTDTIDEVKDKVLVETGIPKDNQRLAFNGRPLDRDARTLEDYDIEHEDALDLEPMKIKVKDPDGRIVDLVVDPEDTIDYVKKQVRNKLGTPVEDQHPTFNGEPLPDDTTLSDNGIRHGDIIDLQPMEINVKDPTGRTIALPVAPDDTIRDLKKQSEKAFGIPTKDQRPTFNDVPLPDDSTLSENGIRPGDTIDLQPMEINVKDPTGRTVNLVVDPEDTIRDIKKQLKKALGIPAKEQRPTFNDNPLPDNSTLKENGIHHGDTIDLQPMHITVKAPNGHTVDLVVDPNETVDDIKERVEGNLGIPVDDQRPTFNGIPLPNNSTLADNKIHNGDTIDLQPMKICVRFHDGRTVDLVADPDDSIDDIKDRVEEKLGIPVDDHLPTFEDIPLADDSTLRENDIRHGDTIDLQPKQMEIQVRAPDGRTIDLVVDPEDTIDDIKEQIEKQADIPVKNQRPVCNGSPLLDGSTLRDNNICNGDAIELQPMQIFVIDLDGRKRTYTVDPFDTIESIKDMLEDDTGVEKKYQRLTFEGDLLDKDGSTLENTGIEDHDTLKLEPLQIHLRLPKGKKITLNVDPYNTTPDDLKDIVKDREAIEPEDQILSLSGNKLVDPNPLKDYGVQHGDIVDVRINLKAQSPEPSPTKKKSYLTPEWRKEQEERYGKVIVTRYRMNYDGDYSDSIIDGIISKDATDFKLERPTLQSEKNSL